MKVAPTSRSEVWVGIAAIIVCPIVAGLAAVGGTMPTLAVAGLLVMIVGVYIALRHPLWLFWGLAVVLGALPYGYVPGVHVPLYLLFAAGAITAAVLHPTTRMPVTPLAKSLLALVLASAVALIFTVSTVLDVLNFIKWAVTTLVFFALLALPREHLARFGRIFVYASAANALIGIGTVAMGTNQTLLRPFRIFDYAVENTQRFSFTNGGETRFIRLGGLWLDPNGAGIGLVVALVVALLVLSGRRRIVVTAILLLALPLTLSRAAAVCLLTGTLLVLLFHKMRSRDRSILIGLLTVALVAAPLIPSVRSRLLLSFGADDAGAEQRLEALKEFPGRMSGHWLFGWGWGRREFMDGAYAFKENFVSNAPLISIHRAGVFVGLLFVLTIVIGCVMSYRLLRSSALPGGAFYGGVFIGFSVFTLNLDHPVVVIPQVTLVYTVFLVFLVYADELRRQPPPTTSPSAEFLRVPADHAVASTRTQ